MINNEFYSRLSTMTGIKWEINEDNFIVGTHKKTGTQLNPVTALASVRGVGQFTPNKRDTLKAGAALGLPREFVEHAINASNSASNRGNAQVVRGKIRSALGV
jgi:hypothetical protein